MQYRIYKDNVKIKETTTKQVEITGLKPKTTYTLGVSAYNGLRESTRATITMTTRGLVMIVDKALQVGSEVTFEYVEYALGLVPIGTEPSGMFGGGNKQTLKGEVISTSSGKSKIELKSNFNSISDELELKTNLLVANDNLLTSSNTFSKTNMIGTFNSPNLRIEDSPDSGIKMLHINSNLDGGIYFFWNDIYRNDNLKVGDKYTFSFDAKGVGKFFAVGNESGSGALSTSVVGSNITSDWVRYSVTSDILALNKSFVLYFKHGYDAYIKCPKVEKGVQSTPWCLSRYDVYGTDQLSSSYSAF
ncbi:hypothetical protein QFF56_03055 [Ligilactobacillus animalis]|uniref:Baseplate upper protein immunoglobulin like domain-containing protein n=1 Tax=Ligilactobacillus animalis TaxID=1605 RepID=A0AAJ6K586_9LACO|nr:hypothetical protein [Ligilactobacillus animalis]WHQ80678.1 hypothetical protein QFF56_03055 [Ligilactobacillus animalis]